MQRVDICCHACVLRVSERMRGCVRCAGGTGWGLIKERGTERALGTGCDPGECVCVCVCVHGYTESSLLELRSTNDEPSR